MNIILVYGGSEAAGIFSFICWRISATDALSGRDERSGQEGLEHREKSTPDFSSRYGTERLVWFEADEAVTAAIEREKEIKT
jgi:hypothetical protein